MMYINDHTCDCESEGHIRFTDKKTNLDGMLNQEGDIVIPAKYYYLSKVHNGLIVGTKGPSKKYLHDCENNFSILKLIQNFFNDYITVWESHLLDTTGKALIKDFDSEDINLYSLKKSIYKPFYLKKYQRVFIGTDDNYYTFNLYKETFKNWLQDNILLSLNKESFLTHTKTQKQKAYVTKNFKKLKNKLLEIQKKKVKYFLSRDLDSNALDIKYFDNCDDYKVDKYPIFSFIIGSIDNREYISFVKDGDSYYFKEALLLGEP